MSQVDEILDAFSRGAYRRQMPVTNPNKDRRLPGKKRVRARRQANRQGRVLVPASAPTAPQPVPLADLGLSARVYKPLARYGVEDSFVLRAMLDGKHAKNVRDCPGIGPKAVKEIEEALNAVG